MANYGPTPQYQYNTGGVVAPQQSGGTSPLGQAMSVMGAVAKSRGDSEESDAYKKLSKDLDQEAEKQQSDLKSAQAGESPYPIVGAMQAFEPAQQQAPAQQGEPWMAPRPDIPAPPVVPPPVAPQQQQGGSPIPVGGLADPWGPNAQYSPPAPRRDWRYDPGF